MIAIGTKNLSKLIYDGIFDLKKFSKEHSNIGFIETSLNYDNDLFLKNLIPEGFKIISRFQIKTNLEINLEFHRISLGIKETEKDRICIMLKDVTEEDETEIKPILGTYLIGLEDPEIEDIERFKNYFGRYPSMVSTEINPLFYPKDLLDFCHENKIAIIGHGIFGGDRATEIRSMFPDGFLMEFAKYNTDIQVLPGDDVYFIEEMTKKEKNINQVDGKILKYSRNINKNPRPELLPKKIYGQTILNIPNLGTIKFSCGDRTDKYFLKPQKDSVEVDKILWEDEEIEETDKNLLSTLHRYHSQVWIDEHYSPKFWKKIYKKISPDFYIIKLIPRHWYYGWIAKEHVFWMISGKLIKIPIERHDYLINE